MKLNLKVLVLILFACATKVAISQRYLADYDSSLFIKDTLRPFLKRYENLHFSGYMQPQFQVIQHKPAIKSISCFFSQLVFGQHKLHDLVMDRIVVDDYKF